ncbi:AI-2E family transporter [Prosthecobacter sp.]|uniref:AI-2E family transporter n=1 Tax=Prosthecobacter sp. TaxID=1965333 RepID=UPI002ABBD0D2|nr:AI-2E family transporter [Prosthecobacter sp.]MDZ4403602.1 AI-2E family transporter [Prosthecobacter sp.]
MNQLETKQMADPIANDWGSRSHVQTLVLMVATAFGIYLCYRLAVPFLPPLAWALGLAVLFTPFQRWVESKLKHPRLAAFVSVLVIGVIVVVPLTFVGQRLVVQAAKGADLIETKVTSGEWRRTFAAQPLLAPLADKIEKQIDLPGTVKSFAIWLSSSAGSIVTGSLLQAIDFCLTFYLLFFFLRDRRAALQTLKSLSPLTGVEMDRIFSRVSDTIHATIYGTLTVSSVQGLLGGLMFWWLGLPAPMLWGVVMALLAVVPVLGAFVVWIPAALLLTLEGSYGNALILTLWGLIVVGTIDNLLRPILVGKRLKLHTILAFMSVVGGLIQFGPAGLILGPAVLAVTTVLLEIWSGRNSAELGFEPGELSGFERQGGLEDHGAAKPRLNKPSS